ncbi:MAG TPA: alcohol dehydrogenase catalytic domain-containing protein [Phycisphaerae bacterium]|nr:alcohol dehydrogenase catalytic domain-containing protein [Phycisphaerae bacterium]
MSKVEAYRKLKAPYGTVPSRQKAWRLHAAGLANLSCDEVSVSSPGPDELLARVDAVGICASDHKMISQGEAHSRMQGRNLKANPAIPGHEVSLTLVAVGADLKKKFQVGRRYSVQADIYVDQVPMAFGYQLAGADQQYVTIPPLVHEGGFLLPVDDKLSYSSVAVSEPWACVLFSYENQRDTKSVKPGGTAWYMGCGPLGLMHIEKGIRDGAARVIVSEMKTDRLDYVRRTFGPLAESRGCELVTVDLNQQKIDDVLPPKSCDDIIVVCPVAKAAVAALPFLSLRSFMNVFAGFPSRDASNITLNLNDMHYGQWTLLATSGSPIESLQQVLDMASKGAIDPNNSVAAVGGIGCVQEGIDLTHKGVYPGRIVIYPQIDLPLTPVGDLTGGKPWTREAEEKLLESKL